MSLEVLPFVSSLPDRAPWQAAIDRLGIDLTLDPELGLEEAAVRWGALGRTLHDYRLQPTDGAPSFRASCSSRALRALGE